MSATLDTLTAKHKEFSDLLSTKNNYLTQILQSQKQLKAEAKKTEGEISELRGALNVLGGSLEMLKKELTAVAPVTVTAVAEPEVQS